MLLLILGLIVPCGDRSVFKSTDCSRGLSSLSTMSGRCVELASIYFMSTNHQPVCSSATLNNHEAGWAEPSNGSTWWLSSRTCGVFFFFLSNVDLKFCHFELNNSHAACKPTRKSKCLSWGSDKRWMFPPQVNLQVVHTMNDAQKKYNISCLWSPD